MVFCFTLILVGQSVAVAENATNRATISTETDISLLPYLQQWLPAQAVDFAQVRVADQQQKFTAISTTTIPVLNRDIWYRFELIVQPPYNNRIFLNFRELMLDEVQVYFFADGHWQSTSTGLNLPFNQRPVDYRFFAVPLTTEPATPSVVYFRVKAFTRALVAPSLETQNRFLTNTIRRSNLSVATLGATAGVIIYLWIVSRVLLPPIKQFAFLGFLTSTLLLGVFEDGHLSRLANDWVTMSRLGYIFTTGCVSIFSLLYCRYFFDLKENNRLLNNIISLLIAAISISIGFSLVAGPEAFGQNSFNFVSLVLLLLVVIGIYALQHRLQGARHYCAAITCYLLVETYRWLVRDGAIDYSATYHNISYFGLWIFTFFLSIGITHQISSRVKRQFALERRAIEADARNSAKSNFLATMSHEIRTPINGVLGMAQLLSESRLDSTQRHYVDILLNSGRTLLNVINDILDLSKVEANKLKLDQVCFNLDQLLLYAVATFSQANKNEPIKFKFEQLYPLPFYLKGDPTRLQQVINNLLSNAFKFTERGTITLRVQQLSSSTTSTTIKFSIIDNGPGIPAEAVGTMFEPYTQADQSSTRRVGGTGLGLAICKQLVAIMGGEIGVNSSPGQGSEFWFTVTFELDIQRQQLLDEITKKLQQAHIAVFANNLRFTLGFINYVETYNIPVKVLDSDSDPGKTNFELIDVLLLSNSAGADTTRWFKESQRHGVGVILFNSNNDNVLGSTDLTGANVVVINPPYGISQVMESVHRIISGTTDIEQLTLTASTAGHDLSRLKVLVAEDNIINTKVISAMLATCNIEADYATTGRQAVGRYEEANGDYDLILMDCEMPDMDGYEATQNIRRLENSGALPASTIFALTAHALEENRVRCIAAGMDGVLTKPLQKSLLIGLLESVSAQSNS